MNIEMQISRRGIAAIDPTRPESPENGTLAVLSVGYPATTIEMNISPITGDHRKFGDVNTVSSGLGPIFRSIGSNLCVGQACANEQQLPDKQSSLHNGDTKKRQSKRR